MPVPATVLDIPHTLGREEARRRIRARIGELPSHIPGGAAQVRSSWPSEDRLLVDVTALGQAVAAAIDVDDRVIRVRLDLPPILGLAAGPIVAAVRRNAATLLLGAGG